MPASVYSEIEEKLPEPTLCPNDAIGEIENAGCACFRCEASPSRVYRSADADVGACSRRASRLRKAKTPIHPSQKGWRMSRTINVITIGHPSAFRQLHAEGKYAVFIKTRRPCLPDLYVVGRLLKTARDFQPASAIAFFNSEASAIEALKRWALDPVVPKPPPRCVTRWLIAAIPVGNVKLRPKLANWNWTCEPTNTHVRMRMKFVHRFSRSDICEMTVSDEPPSKVEATFKN